MEANFCDFKRLRDVLLTRVCLQSKKQMMMMRRRRRRRPNRMTTGRKAKKLPGRRKPRRKQKSKLPSSRPLARVSRSEPSGEWRELASFLLIQQRIVDLANIRTGWVEHELDE